jgi:hypothetical protein
MKFEIRARTTRGSAGIDEFNMVDGMFGHRRLRAPMATDDKQAAMRAVSEYPPKTL